MQNAVINTLCKKSISQIDLINWVKYSHLSHEKFTKLSLWSLNTIVMYFPNSSISSYLTRFEQKWGIRRKNSKFSVLLMSHIPVYRFLQQAGNLIKIS